MQGHAYTAAAMPSRRTRASYAQRPGALGALAVAGLCLLAGAVVWALADLVPAVQLRDALALQDFTNLSRPGVDGVANFLLHLIDVREFILWGIALVSIALARDRPRVAAAVVAVLALAPFTAETLKPLVAHPHVELGAIQVGSASWPSGHSTAALALVLCAVLVSPVRLRPLVGAVGALFALSVGCSLLILAWHMPSDVIGGYLVAAFWTALAVAALRAADRRWPPRLSS